MNEVELGVGALAGVATASVAAAAFALLVMRRWSDQQALRTAKARAQAHLLELRLFLDDPLTVLRSQRALIMDNVRIMRLLGRPMLLMSVPVALLMWQLDALYGRAPLRTGEAAPVSFGERADTIEAPDGIAVETKPLHIRVTGETCWRIRPLRATSGRLRIADAEARIVSGPGIAYLPGRLIGRERIVVGYPPARVLYFHWLTWFVLFSAAAAFALRGPLRVTF